MVVDAELGDPREVDEILQARRQQKRGDAGFNGDESPRIPLSGAQVMDPITAYQITSMMEGVVQRGTATVLRDLNRPLFGKTGTTSGPTNVWFIGGNQEIVGGVYLGYDQPRSLGGYAKGGTIAAPIFKQLV